MEPLLQGARKCMNSCAPIGLKEYPTFARCVAKLFFDACRPQQYRMQLSAGQL